ncbi:MAG: nucleotidyltransferase [Pyrinomonadaceae bacterium]|nr:nucleotidyltransferase [Pyrinomonadaceae bacterium]
MAIPESQLETWSHQGSITQSCATYATVKRSLEASDTKYADKSYEVFLQGSYGNDTNIYDESDVDVVIRLNSVYYYDISALTPAELAAFNAAFSPGTYPYATYKADVVAALERSFGAADVSPEKKAVKIKANGGRRSADVLVACEFRRYLSGFPFPRYESGVCFFDSGGNQIVNYPKQHSINCTAKHQATNQWFKPMVRILKNMRGKLVETAAIEAGSAPSYFLEGLLYNVPAQKFGMSYDKTFVAAVNWILSAERNDLECANEQYYLVRDSFSTCWPSGDFDQFINKVVQLWNNWV